MSRSVVYSIEARAASALGAAGKSLWVPCRGAKMVIFRCSATDAGTLLASGVETFNGDAAAVPAGGWSNSGGIATFVAGLSTANAMNSAAGPLICAAVPASALPFLGCNFIRMTYTPTTSVAGFRVVAEVYFDDDSAAMNCGNYAALGLGASS